MEKYAHLPEVAELERFVADKKVPKRAIQELSTAIMWGAQATRLKAADYCELLVKVATAVSAMLRKQEGA